MVLTPEEVISKTFQPTRFAEGYNQDEVDDFLDEVVGTLRSLHQQIDDLEAQLKESQDEVQKLSAAPSGDEPAKLAVVGSDSSKADDAPQESGQVIDLGVGGAAGDGDTSAGAAGMLALAQRLHDEHVRDGQRQRDQLLAEARTQAHKLVYEAEEKRTNTLSTLELERDQLEDFINSLRGHEQEYRTRLRSFLQAQLTDLEGQQSLEPSEGR